MLGSSLKIKTHDVGRGGGNGGSSTEKHISWPKMCPVCENGTREPDNNNGAVERHSSALAKVANDYGEECRCSLSVNQICRPPSSSDLEHGGRRVGQVHEGLHVFTPNS